MRRRVLHLIDTGGPGGAETVLRDVATGLDRSRWESIAAVPVRDWLHCELQRAGIEPILLTTRGSFDVRYLRKLVALCRRDVSVIHAHLLMTSVYGAVAGRITGVPLVCTFHGPADIARGTRLRNLKFRIIDDFGRARVAFVSETLRNTFLAAVPLHLERTEVVPNGIDAGRFRSSRSAVLRQELGLCDGELLIGAVGNLRPSKSYDVLLKSAAILRERGVAFRMVIAGQPDEGPLRFDLEVLHRRLGLGNSVRFLGFRQDIPELMACFDVYVSSSTNEGFSLTTVEAMAAGIPVCATRSGGPEEIIEHDRTGLLVPARSPVALATGLEQLLGDAPLRLRLAQAARSVASTRYTIPAMVKSYETLYEVALSARHESSVA